MVAILSSLKPTSPTCATSRAKFLIIPSIVVGNIGAVSSIIGVCGGGVMEGYVDVIFVAQVALQYIKIESLIQVQAIAQIYLHDVGKTTMTAI